MNTTVPPGTVTFQLFGRELELLPRVLVIDWQEHSWRPETVIANPVSISLLLGTVLWLD